MDEKRLLLKELKIGDLKRKMKERAVDSGGQKLKKVNDPDMYP